MRFWNQDTLLPSAPHGPQASMQGWDLSATDTLIHCVRGKNPRAAVGKWGLRRSDFAAAAGVESNSLQSGLEVMCIVSLE